MWRIAVLLMAIAIGVGIYGGWTGLGLVLTMKIIFSILGVAMIGLLVDLAVQG